MPRGPPDNRTNEQKLAELQGTWEVTEITDDGVSIPKDKIKGYLFVFQDDSLTWIYDGKKDSKFRVKFAPQHGPQSIELIRRVVELKPNKGGELSPP